MNPKKKIETIDYDAIMKSIKINTSHPAQNLSPLRNRSIQQPFSNTNQNRESLKGIKYLQSKRSQHNLTNVNKNIYSSIIQDDLSKQSCFESVYRPLKEILMSSIPQKIPVQFMFYENSSRQAKLLKNQTPNKQKVKRMLTNNWDKQNNSYMHNAENTKAVNKQQTQHHRYLSHTETSQKKIKGKRGEAGNPKGKGCSPKVITKQRKQKSKSGIQVIRQKYYHS